MDNSKSLLLTYIFSLIGGLFGIHHLYLGRTQHALLWITTVGGFGIGFIYEFLFLFKQYVDEANNDRLLLNEYRLKMARKKSPAFEIARFCGQYLTAVFYGFITHYAFPETWHEKPILSLFIGCCSTIAIALGTQITGTIGPRQCFFFWPLLGATLGMPLLLWRIHVSPSFNIAALLSSLLFEWKVEWNLTYFSNRLVLNSSDDQFSISPKQIKRKRRHTVKRYLIFGISVVLFTAIFTSAIYQNLQVDFKGRRVKIKDILIDYIQSHESPSIHQKLLNIAKQIGIFYLRYGVKGICTQIWMILDFESEKQALEVLDLNSMISQKDIESHCRTLYHKWHPDKYQDPEQKQNAQIKFMNIREACDRLSKKSKRRQLIDTQKSADNN